MEFFFRNNKFFFFFKNPDQIILVQIRCNKCRPNSACIYFKLLSRQKYLDSGLFLETPRLIRHKAQDARLGYISNAKPQKPKSRVLAPDMDVAISGRDKWVF